MNKPEFSPKDVVPSDHPVNILRTILETKWYENRDIWPMNAYFRACWIDMALLRVWSKLEVELATGWIIFTVQINSEGLFEVIESSDNRLPVGTTYTHLTETWFDNCRTLTGTWYIHRITML